MPLQRCAAPRYEYALFSAPTVHILMLAEQHACNYEHCITQTDSSLLCISMPDKVCSLDD